MTAAQDSALPTSPARQQLGDAVVDTVKSTAPVLAEHGETITALFYQKMFQAHPELLNIFNTTNQKTGQQKHALAASVYNFAAHIEELDVLKAEIERIGNKHASLNVKPEHYPIVGKYLMQATHEVVSGLLGQETADAVVDAWTKAYALLADLLIHKEETLYSKTESGIGGWRDTREFVLSHRQQESTDVVSFTFQPADHGPIAPYEAGQYIAISVKPEGSEYTEIRQYSLSEAWTQGQQHYRISVKRIGADQDKPAGLVSNYLHDHLQVGDKVQLAPPRGEFTLAKGKSAKPIVLLSGGVGITPVFSMLETLVQTEQDQPLVFVHGTENSQHHVFKQELDQLQQTGKVDNVVFYREPSNDDKANEDYDHTGMVDLNKIKSQVNLPNADYYLCGPLPFMQHINQQLVDWGVAENQIHYEIFGPNRSLATG